ncbi:hypothetical protein BKE38_01980 [Pseudoroseomonas deserti]|uniref:DUF3574 domain-containing protein n=1 Tax=Teichococcus deserti TaxID=1817963 RepID=A0A1V2H7H0_9PROT|nr:DUF3574 domain-containing protein [Pseudoroseomonas deserti]ONG58726.1 hypothetical protein BKE38_01980 [Pseudoroseomonas deserti]
MQLSFLVLLPLLAACSPCPSSLAPVSVAELFFGRGLPDGGFVPPSAWDEFLADVVTPAFPDGLTVEDSAGQWRNADGQVIREPSKHLMLVLPGTDAAGAAHRAAPLAQAWRQRHGQDSVLLLVREACAAF